MASLSIIRLISTRLPLRKLLVNHSALNKKSSTLLLDYFAHRQQQQIAFFGNASVDTWRFGINELTGKNHIAQVRQLSNDSRVEEASALVYDGTMNQMVSRVKQFSLFTSAAILFSQPFMWGELAALNNVILQSVLCGGLSFFMLGTPILIHRMTMKYVLNMTLDRETKTFEVTTYSIILRKKKMQFTQSDITIPPTPLPFTTIYAKGKPLFLCPDGWKSRFAYDHLMLLDRDTLKSGIDWSKLKAQ